MRLDHLQREAVAATGVERVTAFSRMPMPTPVAIQWVEVTTPNVPSISGRVVKRDRDLCCSMAVLSLGPFPASEDHRGQNGQ